MTNNNISTTKGNTKQKCGILIIGYMQSNIESRFSSKNIFKIIQQQQQQKSRIQYKINVEVPSIYDIGKFYKN